MKEDFKIIDSGKSYAATIKLGDNDVRIIVPVDAQHTLEDISWTYVDGAMEFIKQNYNVMYKRAADFAGFLVNNSSLYSEEERNMIKGYVLSEIEIPEAYGKRSSELLLFEFALDMDSEQWIDVYGYILVKFLMDRAVGVERIQY